MSGDQWQEPMESDLAADQRSPEEIEWEIERTRERMSSNIDALGDRLSRDHLKQQAKEAIAEKAHDVVFSEDNDRPRAFADFEGSRGMLRR